MLDIQYSAYIVAYDSEVLAILGLCRDLLYGCANSILKNKVELLSDWYIQIYNRIKWYDTYVH